MPPERIAQLTAILEQEPRNTLARYAIGIEYASANEVDLALDAFRQVLEIDPNYVNAYAMATQMLSDAGRETEAIEWLGKGIACAEQAGNHHAADKMQSLLDEINR